MTAPVIMLARRAMARWGPPVHPEPTRTGRAHGTPRSSDPYALVEAYSRELVDDTTREAAAPLAFDALHDVLHEHADDGHGHCRQDGAGSPCVTVRAITAALSFTPPQTADYDYRSRKVGGAP